MKKNFLIVLFLIAVFSISIAAFSDLSSSHWAYESVMYLTELGIISGMPDGTFRGNDPMTRYQSAVAMKRLLDFSNTHKGVHSTVPSDLQSRLAELEALVNRSLNAVEQVGNDYRLIMEKIENTNIGSVNGGLEYNDLERLVDEILEVKLDERNIEVAVMNTNKEIESLKAINQNTQTQLEMNNQARVEINNRMNDMQSKITTYRWVSITSAVIAISSLVMASYVLLK